MATEQELKAAADQFRALDAETVELIVHPRLPLPHVVNYQGKNFEFTPTGKVPGGFAKMLLINRANLFAKYDGQRINKSIYTWKPRFTATELVDKFNRLGNEQKETVNMMIDKLLNPVQEPEETIPAQVPEPENTQAGPEPVGRQPEEEKRKRE